MSLAEKRPQTEDTLNRYFGNVRPTRWVTRERPKIDRIACPWVVRRFIDHEAEIIYVPAAEVFSVAEARAALAFDIPGAPITH